VARLYANENFPLPVVEELRRLGHDVLTIHETGQAGQLLSDEAVLAFACADGRALLTLNRRHFIRLHREQPRHAGIIVCTFDPDFVGQARRIHDAIEAHTGGHRHYALEKHLPLLVSSGGSTRHTADAGARRSTRVRWRYAGREVCGGIEEMNCRKRSYFLVSLAASGLLLLGLFLLLTETPPMARADPGSLFVKPDGLGTACTQAQPCSLQTAVAQANAGDTIYVGQGDYTDTGAAVITVTKSIALYGGWDGAASGPVGRDPAAHPTILDGQGTRRVVQITGPCTPTLDGLTITNGNANNTPFHTGRGGGIHGWDASPIIQNNVIIHNVGGITPTNGVGGGLLLYGASASALISGNLVLSNTAGIGGVGTGGGLSLQYSAVVVVGNVIQGNVAGTDQGWGGGLDLREFNGTVRGNLIQGNVARSYGYGGGMRVSYGSPRILDNEIRGNSSDRNGGGIYVNWGTPLIQGNRIVGNAAGSGWNGGGILVDWGNPTIAANYIVSNTAGSSSGLGLETGDYFTVTNNVIAHNNTDGIRLWELTCYGLIAHNTIAFNGGEGGIRLNYPYITPTIVNNIIVSNTYGISAHENASGTLDYNDVWGNTVQDYDLPGALQPGPHAVQADPHFVHAAGDDYHLRAGSPCIDVGMDAGVTSDMDGDTRPIGLGYDIGADEFRLLHLLYLPLVMKNHP